MRGPASRIPTVNEKFWFCRYDDSHFPWKFFGIPKIFVQSKNLFEMKCKYSVKNSRTSCMLMPGTPGEMKMGNNQRNKFWCNNKNRIPITCPRADFLYILISLSFLKQKLLLEVYLSRLFFPIFTWYNSDLKIFAWNSSQRDELRPAVGKGFILDMISWFPWNFWKIKQFPISNRCTIYPNFRLKSNFPWLVFTRFLRWKCQCYFTLILTFSNQIWIRLKPSLELELNLSELLKTNHYRK